MPCGTVADESTGGQALELLFSGTDRSFMGTPAPAMVDDDNDAAADDDDTAGIMPGEVLEGCAGADEPATTAAAESNEADVDATRVPALGGSDGADKRRAMDDAGAVALPGPLPPPADADSGVRGPSGGRPVAAEG